MSRTLIAAVLAAALVAVPLAFATSPAAAQTTTSDTNTQAKPKRPVSAGQEAMHDRQRKCGAEWKAAKAAGKIEKGMTWPKYWSACNKRLKTGG